MSALKPNNGKYRRSWKIWGRQMVPSKQYCDNYDKIEWGESRNMEKEELTSPLHYRVRFKSSGQ